MTMFLHIWELSRYLWEGIHREQYNTKTEKKHESQKLVYTAQEIEIVPWGWI